MGAGGVEDEGILGDWTDVGELGGEWDGDSEGGED